MANGARTRKVARENSGIRRSPSKPRDSPSSPRWTRLSRSVLNVPAVNQFSQAGLLVELVHVAEVDTEFFRRRLLVAAVPDAECAHEVEQEPALDRLARGLERPMQEHIGRRKVVETHQRRRARQPGIR